MTLYSTHNKTPLFSNASFVVKPVLRGRISPDANGTEDLKAEIEKFILRCTCKYETRNVTMIKVVILFIHT